MNKRNETILSKKFIKEISDKDSKLLFTKKKFNNKTQEIDLEKLLIENDTIIYTFNNPKKYIRLIKALDYRYNSTQNDKSKSKYTRKNFNVNVEEVVTQDLKGTNYIEYRFLIFENKYPLFWYKLVMSSASGFVLSAILFSNKTPL